MSKLIIENRSDLSDEIALKCIISVISEGRISNNDKQYCYASTFKLNGKVYVVVTDLNKKSDRFIFYKQQDEERLKKLNAQ